MSAFTIGVISVIILGLLIKYFKKRKRREIQRYYGITKKRY
ncbi:hypothetical protein [Pseudofulvibacter geojedonensis]